MSKFTDIGVEKAGHVGTIEIRRPPLNFFDVALINQIADALAQTAPPGEGYLEELARLETARKMAEMQVTREMLLVDPEDQERIAQLLG